MSTTQRCACGIPARADFHVHAVISRPHPIGVGTESDSVDLYICAEHMTGDVRSLLTFDGADGWDVLEARTTGLRYRLQPGDVIGWTDDGDTYCPCHAAAHASRDAVSLRRDALEVDDWPTCEVCGKVLLAGQTFDAVADVIDAARTLGLHAEEIGTGGGCMAVRVVIDRQRVALITDGDAYVPQGGPIVLGGYFITGDGEDEYDGRDVVTVPHDMPRLVSEIRAHFGLEA